MQVSIIIVNWNTQQIICDCLRSIYSQPGKNNCEVIVIDNASSDDSVEVFKRDFPNVILIENNDNRGFAAANNQGIKIAKGKYVLLLNSDTIVLDKAIEKVVDFTDMYPEVAVVGCRVLNPDKTLQRSCFMYDSLLNMFLSSSYLHKLFPKSRFFGRQWMTWCNFDEEISVEAIKGCFMLVRRAAIDQVGLMDEEFFMYAEEADWCYRFRLAGWDIRFAPVGEIIHFGGQSTAQVSGKMLIELRLSILKFIQKHHGWLKYKVACFLTIMFFVIRIPIWLAIAIINGKKRKQALDRSRIYLTGIRRVFFVGVKYW